MTRPFAAGISYLFALMTASICGYGASAVIFTVCAVIFSISLFFRKQIPFITTALGAVTLALFSFLFTYSTQVMPAEALSGKTLDLDCTVVSVTGRDRFSYVCETRHNDIKFRFILKEQPVHMGLGEGDRISGIFSLEKFPDDFRLGGKGNYLSKGIFLSGKVDSYKKCPPDSSRSEISGTRLRRYFSRNLYASMPMDAAQLTDAMLLGNTDALPRGLFEDFSNAGVAHILVVSGMHLSILAEFIRRILSRFPISQKTVCVISSMFVLTFIFMTGFRYALLRAGIMTLVRILCKLPGRDSDAISSLGFSFLLICIPDPFAGGNIGFLLSACATAGIALLPDSAASSSSEKSFIKKLLSPVTSAFSVSLAATLGTLPLTLLMGNEGSLYSVISTVLLSVPASFIIGAGFVVAAAGPFLRWFLAPVIWSITALCRASVSYCLMFRDLPQLHMSEPVILIPAVIFVFAFFLAKSTKVRAAAVSCCGILLIASLIVNTYDIGKSSIFYINDGEDYCAALAENGSAAVFTTTGNSYKLESQLRRKGYRIEGVYHIGREDISGKTGVFRISCPEDGRMTGEIQDRQIVFDNKVSGKKSIKAFISFSKYASGGCDSGFTLLPESDIMNDTANLPAGRYIYGKKDMIYQIRLWDNDKITITCS